MVEIERVRLFELSPFLLGGVKDRLVTDTSVYFDGLRDYKCCNRQEYLALEKIKKMACCVTKQILNYDLWLLAGRSTVP